MAQMGRLSAALAARGTTLVYVTIPAKSQAMPGYLPPRAGSYGFDLTTAEAVYDDIITRLRAEGIVAPDVMRALQAAAPARSARCLVPTSTGPPPAPAWPPRPSAPPSPPTRAMRS